MTGAETLDLLLQEEPCLSSSQVTPEPGLMMQAFIPST